MVELELRTALEASDEEYAYRMLRRIEELAPLDSDCQAWINRIDDQFQVHVETRCPLASFSADALSVNFMEAVDEAEGGILHQISEWRKQRHGDPMLDPYRSVA